MVQRLRPDEGRAHDPEAIAALLIRKRHEACRVVEHGALTPVGPTLDRVAKAQLDIIVLLQNAGRAPKMRRLHLIVVIEQRDKICGGGLVCDAP